MSRRGRGPLPLLAGIGLGVALTLAAQYGAARWRVPGEEPPRSDVLATVDSTPITVEEFHAEFGRRGGAESFPGAVQRRELLDDMVREAVLVAAARRAGYDRDPEVVRQTQYLLLGKYQQEEIETRLSTLQVSDAEVRAAYDAQPERYTIPAAAHAVMIFFAMAPNATAEHRQAMVDLASRVRTAAEQQDATEHFGVLAMEHSNDQASRYQGGDIGWVEQGRTDSGWDPALLEAIFALAEPGTLSPLITAENGIYLVRLLARRPASRRPLAEVDEEIRERLLSEKRRRQTEEMFTAARASLHVQVAEERLADLDLPETEVVDRRSGPPPVPRW